MIFVLATIHVKAEHRADFLENARSVIGGTIKESGCLSYDLTSSITEPNCFVFVERWESRDALAQHFETPHLNEWRRVSADFIDKAEIEIVHPEKVETL